MKKPPIAIAIVSCLYIVTGVGGLARHMLEFKGRPFQYDLVWIALVELVAIVSGIFMLRGVNWARWLALAWIGFHVVISFPSARQVLIHSVIFLLIAYFLLRAEARVYFQHREEAGD
jgi:hypothetical protein